MRRRRAGAALLVAAGLLLAGCGIPTTGVVEAGEPGVGVLSTLTLYFVRTQDGALVALPSRMYMPSDIASAVAMLVKGPSADTARIAGLTTELPAPAGAPAVRTDGDTITIDLRMAPVRLTGTAVDQVVCTALAARTVEEPGARPGRVVVTAAGRRVFGKLDEDACPGVPNAWTFTKPGGAVPTEPR
jgi:hypothetical protein